MIAPVIRKIINNKEVLVERYLPDKGTLFVQKGDVLEPFQKLGDCMHSPNIIYFPKEFEPVKFVREKVYFQKGNVMGRLNGKKVLAESPGYMSFDEAAQEYFFEDMPVKYTLLSGVWGEVQDIVPETSVLIKTRVTEVDLVAATNTFAFGELVVFPNPTEILEKFYLENFIKTTQGKVVYVGHNATLEIMTKANDLKIAAVLAGSADPASFSYAKSVNLGLGVLSGFGKLETPDFIYKLINSVAYRHVFFHGDLGVLRIPVASTEDKGAKKASVTSKRKTPLKVIRKVTKGQMVHVLQKPHFGKIGLIDRVSGSSIFVKFGNDLGAVEIDVPNFYIIE